MSTQAVIEAIEQPEDNSGLKGQIAKLQAEASNRLEAVHQLRVESSTKSKQIEALEADIQKLRVQLYDQTAELEKFRRIEAKRKAARKKKHKRAKKANKKRQFKATPFKDDGKAKAQAERAKWEKETNKIESILASVDGKTTPTEADEDFEELAEHDDVVDLELVASRFPTLAIAQVLDCERRFVAVDTDGSGLIDKDELAEVVKGADQSKVEEIIQAHSLDVEAGLDFLDCLTIHTELSKDQQDQAIAAGDNVQSGSKACVVQ